jgi:hypothetical protein
MTARIAPILHTDNRNRKATRRARDLRPRSGRLCPPHRQPILECALKDSHIMGGIAGVVVVHVAVDLKLLLQRTAP